MLTTALTERLGIEHPLIQAGMGLVAGRALATAVSDAGALGTVATIGSTPDGAAGEIDAVRQATGKPFAVNVVCFEWAPEAEAVFDAVVEARPPMITLSFGDATARVARCRDAGVTTMVQVQDGRGLREALDAGADAVIVQGNEAGGHTGTRGTLSFVAQALELAGDTPIVAAGGIGDGRGLAGALAMGCAGAVMGTRFKASTECLAKDAEKEQIVASDGDDTVYGPIVDLVYGERWPNDVTGRVIRSAFTDEWLGRDEELEAKVAGYEPYGFLVELAQQGLAPNWAGEVSGLVHEVLPAAEIVRRTVDQAEALLARASSSGN